MTPLVLTRPKRLRSGITLAPMIDILMILLVFFMVTSTFLDLDMIPAVPASDSPAPAPTGAAGDGAVILIRVGADGLPTVQGQPLTPAGLQDRLRLALDDTPALRVIVLPSGSAPMQALVSVLDQATQAGAQNLQVVRLNSP